MSALYRKHRPRDFDEFAPGQPHVVQTLRNAVEMDRVAHAYLFAGPRGTGKTSMAKILAKALNCERGPTTTPCLECESCRTIHDATSIDVIELDAASHRGIDDIREIRDRVALQPVRGRRKVYIIDEAHMLTKEASNAVLKTLEEPPAHAVFVLCTTEMTSMLPTIRSRCQRFAFARPGLPEISTVLHRIARAESIEIEPAAVAMIARSAAGSFRDAVSALDQLATASPDVVTVTDVRELLGTTDAEVLFAVVDLVAAGDAAGCLRLVDAQADAGADLGMLVSDLLGHLRFVFLHQQLDGLPDDAPLTDDERARIGAQAERTGAAAVHRLVDMLRDVLEEVREGADPRLPLELALVRVCRPAAELSVEALGQRLAALESRLGGSPAAAAPPPPPAAPPPAPVAAHRPVVPAPPPPAPAVTADPPPAAPPADTAGASADLDRLSASWSDAIVPEIGRRSMPLQSLMQYASPRALCDGEVVLSFPRSHQFALTTADSQPNRELLESVLGQAVGSPVRVRLEVAAAGPDDDVAAAPAAPAPPLDENDLLSELKEKFDAREIEERR
ncbi:MAG TPA: DNA polymerase III subunit gamma/tau [Gaiellales bacterium]|jgi:DNA polymerase-3 subunit gamma/tau